MQVKDLTFGTPQQNILYDEVLLKLADMNGEVMRFWQSPELFIVLGRIGKEHDDIWLERVRQDKIPVLRRTSGGGTVLQGPGCLSYTLILNKKKHEDLQDLRKSYVWISEQVIKALKKCGVDALFKPISDIALVEGHKKISGNAQHRGKNYILHHGTILCNFDLNLIGRYLKMPQDVPEYRKNRSHSDFVNNTQIEIEGFKRSLTEVFDVKLSLAHKTASPEEVTLLENLLQTRSTLVNF